jgi:hypothetical protein
MKEQVLVDASIYPRITRFLFYVVSPSILALLLWPGFIWSFPAEKACSDGVYSTLLPGRVTVANTFVAAAIWMVLTTLWFYFGAQGSVPIPYQTPHYKVSIASTN